MQAANILSAIVPGLQTQGTGAAATVAGGQGLMGIDGLMAGLFAGDGAATATDESTVSSPFTDALAAAMAGALMQPAQPVVQPKPAGDTVEPEAMPASAARTGGAPAPLWIAAAVDTTDAVAAEATIDSTAASAPLQAMTAEVSQAVKADLPAAPTPAPAPVASVEDATTQPAQTRLAAAAPVEEAAAPPSAEPAPAATPATAQAASVEAAPVAAMVQTPVPASKTTHVATKTKAGEAEPAAPAASGAPSSAKAAPSASTAVEALTETAVAAVDGTDAEDAPLSADAKAAPEPVHETALATVQAAQVQPAAAEPPKVSAVTVAHLAAHVVQKAEGGKSTRFDVALNPEGLGRVDVRIEIGAQGQVTAQMNFDNPEAAAQMKSRASELQAALAQAGFDAGQTSLSFNSGGASQDGLWRQQDQDQGARPSWTGRAFSQVADEADAASINPAWSRRGSAGGVDVRI